MKAARITLLPIPSENSNRDRESNAQYPVSVNSTTFVRAPAIDCSKENPHLGINSCSPAGGGVASRALALSPGPSLLSWLSPIRHCFIPRASTIPFWIESARAKAEGSFPPNTSLFRHYLQYHRAPRWNGPADRVSSPQPAPSFLTRINGRNSKSFSLRQSNGIIQPKGTFEGLSIGIEEKNVATVLDDVRRTVGLPRLRPVRQILPHEEVRLVLPPPIHPLVDGLLVDLRHACFCREVVQLVGRARKRAQNHVIDRRCLAIAAVLPDALGSDEHLWLVDVMREEVVMDADTGPLAHLVAEHHIDRLPAESGQRCRLRKLVYREHRIDVLLVEDAEGFPVSLPARKWSFYMRSREQRKSPEGAHRPQRSFYEMRSWFPRNAQWSPRDEVKRQIGSHETKEYGLPFP